MKIIVNTKQTTTLSKCHDNSFDSKNNCQIRFNLYEYLKLFKQY